MVSNHDGGPPYLIYRGNTPKETQMDHRANFEAEKAFLGAELKAGRITKQEYQKLVKMFREHMKKMAYKSKKYGELCRY